MNERLGCRNMPLVLPLKRLAVALPEFLAGPKGQTTSADSKLAENRKLMAAKKQPQGSGEKRPSGVTSKPANGVAQDVILIYPVFS